MAIEFRAAPRRDNTGAIVKSIIPPYVVSCPGPGKRRPTAELPPRTPRQAAALRERKVLQSRVLQSSAAGREHGEMALWAFEKVPFFAIFRHFFDDFPRVFSASLPQMALWARMRPRNALLLNWPRSNVLGKPA